MRSPEEALERTFAEHRERVPWGNDTIFVWQSTTGIDGGGYGSYRSITREELNRRTYEIQLCDYAVGIHWTDTLFQPQGCQHIPKEKLHDQKS